MPIIANIQISPGSGTSYGAITLEQIRNSDDSALQVYEYLGVTFTSPATIEETVVDTDMEPWRSTSVELNCDSARDDSKTEQVEAKIYFLGPHTFARWDRITFRISGDLTTEPNNYVGSFKITADRMPTDNDGFAFIKR